MNDAAVREIWAALTMLEKRLIFLEERTVELVAHVRARLKEEADARKQTYRVDMKKRMKPKYPD